MFLQLIKILKFSIPSNGNEEEYPALYFSTRQKKRRRKEARKNNNNSPWFTVNYILVVEVTKNKTKKTLKKRKRARTLTRPSENGFEQSKAGIVAYLLH